MRNQPYVPKSKILVQVHLSNGMELKGWIFVAVDSRELDVFNSPVTFFPFLDESNQIRFVNKSQVVLVAPLERRQG
ncbi:MAG: hypothetical protein WD673_04920 [Alphaproteobacteria bacterium]